MPEKAYKPIHPLTAPDILCSVDTSNTRGV